MDILFVQSGGGRIATVVTRQDKVRLSVHVYGPLDPSHMIWPTTSSNRNLGCKTASGEAWPLGDSLGG